MTEIWWRNPGNYIQEVMECDENKLIFDFGWLAKRRLNPHPWISAHFGKDRDYRLIICGEQGSPEFRPHTDTAIAVYPTWSYSDDISGLETMVAYNIAEDDDVVNDPSIPELQRPRVGQEHRVIITDIPSMSLNATKKFLRVVAEMQRDNPDVIIHIHGGGTFATPIRLGFGASDWDPRVSASHGSFFTHEGREVHRGRGNAANFGRQLALLGYLPVDTQDARTRCLINIRASVYMSRHYGDDDNLLLQRRDGAEIDTVKPEKDFLPVVANHPVIGRPGTEFGDKIVCDQCSLATKCRQYTPEGVCTLPGTEGKKLADFFQTKDVDTILEGYRDLLRTTADRMDAGRANEIANDELDPEVTKVGSSLGVMIEKYAKLIDPKLRNPKLAIQVDRVGGSDQHLTINGDVDPEKLVNKAMAELVAENGGMMEGITKEMVQERVMKIAPAGSFVPAMPFNMGDSSKVIEG